jgi:prepilin-type N-terminal cleavage/methylation domain-containing protein
MKLSQINNKKGFTLVELMIALGISSLMLAATLISSIALQKSFNAVDNYFATQIQQIRIIEYLNRDVKRSYDVTSTGNPQTVTCTIPNYIIQCGDPDANATCTGTPPVPPSNCTPPGCNIGTRRNPTVTMGANGATVNYGTTPTTSTVVYSISNQSIVRTENGALTTIASSTDNLLPSTNWDQDLSNTQYLGTQITFLPIFTSGGATAERSGTTLFSTAYLRNTRRGN